MPSEEGAPVALAQRLATRAMSLARAGADPEGSVTVLVGLSRGSSVALNLARARCQAAVDQDPADAAASRAVAMLDAALARGPG